MIPGLEIQIIKVQWYTAGTVVHLQKVSATNKVVLYLVINEIVEFGAKLELDTISSF